MGSFTKSGWKLWHSGNGLWGLGNGLWGSGNGLWGSWNRLWLHVANRRPARKATSVHLRTYYKLMGGRLKLFHFSRDTTKKRKVLAAWEASLKLGGNWSS